MPTCSVEIVSILKMSRLKSRVLKFNVIVSIFCTCGGFIQGWRQQLCIWRTLRTHSVNLRGARAMGKDLVVLLLAFGIQWKKLYLLSASYYFIHPGKNLSPLSSNHTIMPKVVFSINLHRVRENLVQQKYKQ